MIENRVHVHDLQATASTFGSARNTFTRRQIMDDNGWSLRDLYRTLETPGDNKLRDAHAALDTAVRAAYGLKEKEGILAFLLNLNLELAAKEAKGQTITPPGLPASVSKPDEFVSRDCVSLQLDQPL